MNFKELSQSRPRLAAAIVLGCCALLVVINVAVLFYLERWYPVLFPLAGAVAPLMLIQLVSGQPADQNQPMARHALHGVSMIAGCAAGLFANHALTGSWFL